MISHTGPFLIAAWGLCAPAADALHQAAGLLQIRAVPGVRRLRPGTGRGTAGGRSAPLPLPGLLAAALSGLTAEEPPLGVPVHGGGHEAEAHLGLGPHVRPADQHFLRVRHLPTPPPVGILHQGGKQQAPLLRRHRQKHWVVVKIDHKAPFWIVHVHSSFYPWREPPVWCTFACHYPLRKG